MRWTVPNILTVFRLLAALGLPAAYVIFPSPWADWIAVTLFVSASLTDYLDGYLARKWNQVSKFGKMLDPIADKAMVIIAIIIVVGLYQGSVLIMIPAVLIVFREVFVSGLREFLGADAAGLKVTKLAKWKTTVQMIAIVALMLSYAFGIEFGGRSHAMPPDLVMDILNNHADDPMGLRVWYGLFDWSMTIGLWGLWLAAALTMITGFDYFRKSLPYLREDV